MSDAAKQIAHRARMKWIAGRLSVRCGSAPTITSMLRHIGYPLGRRMTLTQLETAISKEFAASGSWTSSLKTFLEKNATEKSKQPPNTRNRSHKKKKPDDEEHVEVRKHSHADAPAAKRGRAVLGVGFFVVCSLFFVVETRTQSLVVRKRNRWVTRRRGASWRSCRLVVRGGRLLFRPANYLAVFAERLESDEHLRTRVDTLHSPKMGRCSSGLCFWSRNQRGHVATDSQIDWSFDDHWSNVSCFVCLLFFFSIAHAVASGRMPWPPSIVSELIGRAPFSLFSRFTGTICPRSTISMLTNLLCMLWLLFAVLS